VFLFLITSAERPLPFLMNYHVISTDVTFIWSSKRKRCTRTNAECGEEKHWAHVTRHSL